MNSVWKSMLLVTSSAIALSCTHLKVADVPRGDELMSAAKYIAYLKDKGELPGIDREERGGRFSSVPIHVSDEHPTKPLELTMKATMNKEKGRTFWYRLSRPAADASWQLIEAWQTDSAGNRVNFDLPRR